MKKYFLGLVLLLMACNLMAQDAPKTIYELYEITPGGCLINQTGDAGFEVVEEEPPPIIDNRPPPPPEVQEIYDPKKRLPNERTQAALATFKKNLTKLKDRSIPSTRKLINGNTCFQKNGKWGLQDSLGKVILKPQFDYIKTDDLAGGFVGYDATKCNYYDGQTGKALLAKKYYDIVAAAPNVFIVHDKSGKGIIANGKVVYERTAKKIERRESEDVYWFRIRDEKGGKSILLSDLKTEIGINIYGQVDMLRDGFIFTNQQLYDTKNNKKLFCELKFQMILLDKERQLLSIKSYREKFQFLIDFQGNIISNTPFHNMTVFNGAELAQASIRDRSSGAILWGLIDTKGEWRVAPKYTYISRYKDGFLFSTQRTNFGYLDSKGKEILPCRYSVISIVDEDRFVVGTGTRDDFSSKVINVKTEKTEAENLKYLMVAPQTNCEGKTQYIGESYLFSNLLDENFEVISETHRSFFFKDGYYESFDQNKERTVFSKRRYNCDGKLIPVKIKRKKMPPYQSIQQIHKNLNAYYFNDGTGYFVDNSGKAEAFDLHVQNSKPSNLGQLYSINTFNDGGAGMIDQKGKAILPFEFSYVGDFNSDIGWCRIGTKDGLAGFIDHNGALLAGQLYEEIEHLGLGLFKIKRHKSYGILNKNGVELLPTLYKSVSFENGVITARSFGTKTKYFDRTGKKL